MAPKDTGDVQGRAVGQETGMNKVLTGDALEVLKTLEADSVDLLCTDPPYALTSIVKRFGKEGSRSTPAMEAGEGRVYGRTARGFMGKTWDAATPSVELWAECLRVMKPGAFAFVCMTPRQDSLAETIYKMGQAGFNMGFASIYWTYASGFPKAANVKKQLLKRGNERTEDFDGAYSGFQPKPAVEVIIVAMKPLSEKTYVDQALKNGHGCTWLDDCRIGTERRVNPSAKNTDREAWRMNTTETEGRATQGRFPANLLVEGDVLEEHSRFFSLDAWAQTLPFLIVPKASKGEKSRGLDSFKEKERTDYGGFHSEQGLVNNGRNPQNRHGAKNHHPTVKPLKLMSYLITLGSRPGDLILDPFVGSGTTCIAAKELKRNFIGIEREQEYVEIAEARLAAVNPTLV